jgi:hypothetical protein
MRNHGQEVYIVGTCHIMKSGKFEGVQVSSVQIGLFEERLM